MRLTHGAQFVENIEGKPILKSGAVGVTTVEEVKWLTNTLVSSSAAWKLRGWGYIVDISKMAPVSPEVSQELVGLHRSLAAAGCKAMAFVDFGAFVTSAQAQQHQKQSNTQIQEGHFKTDADAVAWIMQICK